MGPKPYSWQTDLIPVPRKASNKFIEMVEEGLLDSVEAVKMCVKWMSEENVAEMMKANELEEKEDEDD
jgi:hypothetical protein